VSDINVEKDLAEGIKYAAERYENWVKHRAIYQTIIDELMQHDPDYLKVQYANMYSYLNLGVTGNKEGFKRLVQVMRGHKMMYRKDWLPKEPKVEFSTTFTLLDEPTCQISVFFTSSVCKRVKVGTKEVDVYEVQCEEEQSERRMEGSASGDLTGSTPFDWSAEAPEGKAEADLRGDRD
jgi:hypothetical protein